MVSTAQIQATAVSSPPPAARKGISSPAVPARATAPSAAAMQKPMSAAAAMQPPLPAPSLPASQARGAARKQFMAAYRHTPVKEVKALCGEEGVKPAGISPARAANTAAMTGTSAAERAATPRIPLRATKNMAGKAHRAATGRA